MGEDDQNGKLQTRKYLFTIAGIILIIGALALVLVWFILGDSDPTLTLILAIFAFSFFLAGGIMLESNLKEGKRNIEGLIWIVCGAYLIVIGLCFRIEDIGSILLFGIAMIVTGLIIYILPD